MADELRTMVAVGAVTTTSVRIWARSDRPGPHRLVIEPTGAPPRTAAVTIAAGDADGTAAWTYPDDVGGAPLAPDTVHAYRVEHADGSVLGHGRFTTAPRGPRSFRFAMWSCHQPFDEDGRVRPDAHRMLAAVHATLAARDLRFALAIGDQIYADFPPPRSLYDDTFFPTIAPACRSSIYECTRDEVRAVYQRRYREAWAMPELQRIYAELPSWPMLDDHEIVNNFGSLEAHATPAWEPVRDGALAAYHDYQASRVFAARPPTFDHGFRYGAAAFYQLDLRSARRADATHTQILAPAQHAAFARFLAAHADARVLFLTVPVPIAYVPTWLSAVADLLTPDHDGADRWSYANALPDRDRVLGALLDHAHAYPEQRIVLLSGDVHVGMAHELRWEHGPVFYQLTSSAITNTNGALARAVYTLAPHAERTLHRGDDRALVLPIAAADGAPAHNPFGGLNIGIVHVDDDGARTRVRFELVTASADEPPRGETAYLSRWLDDEG